MYLPFVWISRGVYLCRLSLDCTHSRHFPRIGLSDVPAYSLVIIRESFCIRTTYSFIRDLFWHFRIYKIVHHSRKVIHLFILLYLCSPHHVSMFSVPEVRPWQWFWQVDRKSRIVNRYQHRTVREAGWKSQDSGFIDNFRREQNRLRQVPSSTTWRWFEL